MRKYDILIFLVGLFAQIQVRLIGSIGISEIIIFAVAPVLMINEKAQLRRDGFIPLVVLSLLLIAGCVVSCVFNRTDVYSAARGLAATYSTFAIPIVLHSLLTKKLDAVKWFVLGFALSDFIRLIVFNYGEVTGLGLVLGILGSFLVVPTKGWYLQMPVAYLIVSPLCMTFYRFFNSGSGRSSLLCALAGVGLIAICRKNVALMRGLGRHFYMLACLGVVFLFLFKSFYQYAATNGWLSERAQLKYAMQTHGDTSMKQLIMGGRVEFFSALYANVQNPILGYGPWALDTKGYHFSFLEKYGSEEDFAKFAEGIERQKSSGEWSGYGMIPCHTEIMEFWTWYGIMGLIFWIYVVYLIYDVMRHYWHVIPQFFGILALMVPMQLWHVFFSPYGARVERMFFVTLLLIIRAVGKGRLQLPMSFRRELGWGEENRATFDKRRCRKL